MGEEGRAQGLRGVGRTPESGRCWVEQVTWLHPADGFADTAAESRVVIKPCT